MSAGYELHYGEPGVFLEIYLPKKAEYQGLLHKALTDGFRLEVVKEHLRKCKRRVEPFLRPPIADYDRRVDELQTILKGYSMYEVDGVFRGGTEEKPMAYEERTQVIRLMFLPPGQGDDKPDLAHFVDRQYLRHWTHDLNRFRDDANPVGENWGQGRREHLKRWIDDIGLYVNGYIVFSICDAILQLSAETKIERIEEEVWVTSLRGLAVNRVTRPLL